MHRRNGGVPLEKTERVVSQPRYAAGGGKPTDVAFLELKVVPEARLVEAGGNDDATT